MADSDIFTALSLGIKFDKKFKKDIDKFNGVKRNGLSPGGIT